MRTDILAFALSLSDQDLLNRIEALSGTERETGAELVAHLAALELRPNLYAARGYGSLFDYCRQALWMSEDAACNRIRVTRVCRIFPIVLDRLATGALTLNSLRLLGPHLTAENHEIVLARAAYRRRGEIEALVAELAPQPDVVASVRKLPARMPLDASMDPLPDSSAARPGNLPLVPSGPGAAPGIEDGLRVSTPPDSGASVGSAASLDSAAFPVMTPLRRPQAQRPIIKASAPDRYRVQFTIGSKAHDDLRCIQDLLRREIPRGDAGLIFERALARAFLELRKVRQAYRAVTEREH